MIGVELEDAALQRFFAKAIVTLGHDLRTPLGTIVNYAAVLEGNPAPAAGEIRDIAERVRREATRVVEIAQLLADALLLVTSPPASVRGEPKLLLQVILDESKSGIRLVSTATPPDDMAREIQLDPRIVGFAAQAWLSLERIVRPELPRELQLRVVSLDKYVQIELAFDHAPDRPTTAVPIDDYVRKMEVKVPPARRFGLEIAFALLECHGGELELSGAPGHGAALRLKLAPMRPCAP